MKMVILNDLKVKTQALGVPYTAFYFAFDCVEGNFDESFISRDLGNYYKRHSFPRTLES
jgi:hypothetical protein